MSKGNRDELLSYHLKSDFENYCIIYTDGSKKSNSAVVGCSCYCNKLQLEIVKSLPREGSIYTAEAIAINLALDYALSHPNHYKILSDSLSFLQGLKIIACQLLQIRTL